MKEYEPDFSPSGDVTAINQSRVTQDFRIFPIEDIVRGIFYNTSWKSFVFVGRCESIEEIISVCEHEIIHGLIEEEREDTDIEVDEQMEHWVIREMAWAPESLVD